MSFIAEDKLRKVLIDQGVDVADLDAEVALFKRIRPKGARMVVSKPELPLSAPGRVQSLSPTTKIIAPDIASQSLREFGQIATVFSVGPDCGGDVAPGDEVLTAEFSGKPLYLGRSTPYWIIDESELLAIVKQDDEA